MCFGSGLFGGLLTPLKDRFTDPVYWAALHAVSVGTTARAAPLTVRGWEQAALDRPVSQLCRRGKCNIVWFSPISKMQKFPELSMTGG